MTTHLYIDRHADLVERCKQGERKAQYEIYKHYAKTMLNVSMRILNHLGEAEDVLQEAFLDAFSKIQDFRQQATFGAWLKQIVVNRAINQLRQRKVQWVDIQEFGGDERDIAESETANSEDVRLEVEQVRQAMEQLPSGYRVVLSLYLFEGYDHEEIANILDISESTSRSQYLRAKQKLRQIIDDRLRTIDNRLT